MNFFDRLTNGWEISKLSFRVLRANKSLIIFPILSGISLLLIFGSFFTAIFAGFGWDVDQLAGINRVYAYGLTFLCYLVNYFVVVFFNMALIHCARLYFQGEEVTVAKGMQFSMSRLPAILAWAAFAATVGTLLRFIQDNVGWLGKLITGFIGVVWSVATFFTVPILAYERGTPWRALKKSSAMMRDKWGESLSATFSFGLFQFMATVLLIIPALLIGWMNVFAGIAVGIAGLALIIAISSALNTIFVSAVYNNLKGNADMNINDVLFETLFVAKEK